MSVVIPALDDTRICRACAGEMVDPDGASDAGGISKIRAISDLCQAA